MTLVNVVFVPTTMDGERSLGKRATDEGSWSARHGDDGYPLGDGIGGNSLPVPSIGPEGAADNVQREKGRDAARG